MYTNFRCVNYRLFEEFYVPNLARVNLFVGKNNTGKTALLEAIQLHTSSASPEVIRELFLRREEHSVPDDLEPYLEAGELKHLFFNHEFPDMEHPGCMIGPEGGQLTLKLAAFVEKEGPEGSISRVRAKQEELFQEEGDLDFSLAIIIERPNKPDQVLAFLLGGGSRNIAGLRRWYRRSPSDVESTFIQYVPSTGSDTDKVAALWDATILTDLEFEVIKGLRLIEPEIKNVAFVEARRDSRMIQRVPLVRFEGSEARLPLRSLGEGVSRIFEIVLALVNSKDGILLIDEFENGLHWSVHRHIWDIIFRLSEQLNVQVFATTHSRDCVAGFGQAWAREEDACFYRLQRKDSHVSAVDYDRASLIDAIEVDVEVR